MMMVIMIVMMIIIAMIMIVMVMMMMIVMIAMMMMIVMIVMMMMIVMIVMIMIIVMMIMKMIIVMMVMMMMMITIDRRPYSVLDSFSTSRWHSDSVPIRSCWSVIWWHLRCHNDTVGRRENTGHACGGMHLSSLAPGPVQQYTSVNLGTHAASIMGSNPAKLSE